jgi:hypothetical protein
MVAAKAGQANADRKNNGNSQRITDPQLYIGELSASVAIVEAGAH